jgi:hypothetical protein
MIEFDVKGDQLYACYNDGSFPAFFAHVALPVVLTAFPDSKNEWFIGALRDSENENAIPPRSEAGWPCGAGSRAATA